MGSAVCCLVVGGACMCVGSIKNKRPPASLLQAFGDVLYVWTDGQAGGATGGGGEYMTFFLPSPSLSALVFQVLAPR